MSEKVAYQTERFINAADLYFAGFSYSLAGILYSSSLILTSLSILVGIHVHTCTSTLSSTFHLGSFFFAV